jgi:hypothetical protein
MSSDSWLLGPVVPVVPVVPEIYSDEPPIRYSLQAYLEIGAPAVL